MLFRKHLHRSPSRPRQRGVILVVALVVLMIMVISSVGLMRSVDTTISQSGAVGFRRDAANMAEQTMATVLQGLNAGGFLDINAFYGANETNHPNENYSALMLPTTPDGIPTILLDNTAFDAAYTHVVAVSPRNMRARYLIERMCTDPVPVATQLPADKTCILSRSALTELAGGKQTTKKSSTQPQYRITIKVESASNTVNRTDMVSYAQAIVGYK